MSVAAPSKPDLRPPAATAVMAQAGSENFPVASRVLPRLQREGLMAIYGYARLVDDIGDEGDVAQRLELLDWVDHELDRVYGAGDPTHPLMGRLVALVRDCAIPRATLQRLVQANRQDQSKTRYETFDELIDYCRLSATPVGELVLRVLGLASEERIVLSDSVCAGLQVVEHLQDVGEDRAAGRVYLPREDLVRAGCADADLLAATASPALRQVLAIEADRARALLQAGAPLVRRLPPRASIAVAGFVAGGLAALDALAQGDYEVLAAAPRPTRRALAVRWARVLARTSR